VVPLTASIPARAWRRSQPAPSLRPPTAAGSVGFAGGSWVIGPDSDRLAATDAANPIVTVTVDLAAADDAAKQTYPRNVED
jgi:hypothetical protein